ncbi:MAG: hypothetical protein ACTSQI_12395 [Candidatus Helarchaeota archaeon]
MTLSIINSAIDNNIFFSAKRIDINGRRFRTPLNLLYSSVPNDQIPNSIQNRIYEIWKAYNFDDVRDLHRNMQQGVSFNRGLTRAVRPNNVQGELKVFFLALKSFQSNPFRVLNNNLLTFILDSIEGHSDFLTSPILQFDANLVSPSILLDQYLAFIQNCYDIIQTLPNHRPLIGIIPRLPTSFIGRITRRYLQLDIPIFCFDFGGLNLSSYFPYYKEFLRQLYLHDPANFEEKIIYIINLRNPSNRNRNRPFPAHDIMIPAVASDFVGQNHIGRGGTRARTRTTGPRRRRIQNINLLDTNLYSYQRVGYRQEFQEIFSNPIISPSFSNFGSTNATLRNLFRHKFNYCEMSQEFDGLHDQILNNVPILNILRQKTGIRDEISRNIIGARSYIKARTLTSFFSNP